MILLRVQMILWIFCIILQTKAFTLRRKIPIPPVSDVRALVSNPEEVLVTWNHPGHQDVSSFIITWRTLGSGNTPGDGINAQLTQDEIMSWLKGEKTNQNVMIMDVEKRSMLLKTSSNRLQVCVTTQAKKVLGQLICSSTTDLGDILPAPVHLHWTDVGLPGLIWESVEGADSYLLQWEQVEQELDELTDGVGGHSYSSGFTFRFDKGLTPGFWRITVRAITGRRLGDPTTYYKEIKGMLVQAKQIGMTDIQLRWRVFPQEPKLTATYDIIASQDLGYKVMILNFECESLESNCETSINDVKFTTNKVLTVTVKSSDPAQMKEAQTTLQLTTLPSKPSNLKWKLDIKKTSEAVITWNCINPKVSFHIVSVFWNKAKRHLIKKISKLPTCSLILEIDNLQEYLVEVEACLDQTHCSRPSSLKLKLNYDQKINIKYFKNSRIGLSSTSLIIIATIIVFLKLIIIYVLIYRIEQAKNVNFYNKDTTCYEERKKLLYGHND